MKDPAMKNPKVMAALQDIMKNPANISKYQNDPEIMGVISRLAAKMQGAGGMPGGMGGMPGGMGGMPGGMGGMPGGMPDIGGLMQDPEIMAALQNPKVMQ